MKGLLLKHYYIVRTQRRVWFVIAFLFFLLSVEGRSLTNSSSYCWLITLPMHMQEGEHAHAWNAYCGVLPCSKKQIVTARYWSCLILQGAIFVGMMLTQAIRLAIYGIFTWSNYISLLSFLLLLMSFLHAPLLLLSFIGKKWANVLAGILIMVYYFFTICFREADDPFPSLTALPAIILACAALYVLSWWLAVKVYQKQEIV